MSQEPDIYDSFADDGKDYILQIKVKNGPLLRALRMRGFKNVRRFCAETGCCESMLGKYLSLQSTPLNSRGDWKASALALARHLRLPPDALFPEQHLDRALAKASGEVEVSRAEIAALVEHNDPDEAENRERLALAVEGALGRLSPREERVLRLRNGFNGEPKTLKEVGKALGVQQERVRQIEAKALRRMRSFTSLKSLSDAGYEPAQNTLDRHRRA